MGSQLSEPLFDQEAIEGEINAINEEYQTHSKVNNVRYLQAIASECDKFNLFNRFCWGSKESLGSTLFM